MLNKYILSLGLSFWFPPLQSYIISFFCASLEYDIIQNVLGNMKKMDCYLLKIELYLWLFIALQVNLGSGCPAWARAVVWGPG